MCSFLLTIASMKIAFMEMKKIFYNKKSKCIELINMVLKKRKVVAGKFPELLFLNEKKKNGLKRNGIQVN